MALPDNRTFEYPQPEPEYQNGDSHITTSQLIREVGKVIGEYIYKVDVSVLTLLELYKKDRLGQIALQQLELKQRKQQARKRA